jgi:CRP/FNR family transcriptional regulator, dissimilatory nitrate respiration regulator
MTIESWVPTSIRAVSTERTLRAGQVLFRMGSRTTGLYQLVSGNIRLVRVDSTGRETVLYVATPGDTLAEASLFSARYHCDAIASSIAVVRLYPKLAILAEFERDPKVAQVFMAMQARQVMSLRTRLQLLNIRSARNRIRDYMVLNAGPGQIVSLTGTLKDLAADLGLTHEALYRTLASMAARGEIERSPGKLRMLAFRD